MLAEDKKDEVWKLEANTLLLDGAFEEDTLERALLQGLKIELSEVFREIDDNF